MAIVEIAVDEVGEESWHDVKSGDFLNPFVFYQSVGAPQKPKPLCPTLCPTVGTLHWIFQWVKGQLDWMVPTALGRCPPRSLQRLSSELLGLNSTQVSCVVEWESMSSNHTFYEIVGHLKLNFVMQCFIAIVFCMELVHSI